MKKVKEKYKQLRLPIRFGGINTIEYTHRWGALKEKKQNT